MRIAKACVCCNSRNIKSTSAVLMPFIAHRIFNHSPVLIKKKWKLTSIKSGSMAYSLCNTLFCLNCNLIFLDMRFDKNELRALYHNYRDKDYENLREKYEPGYKLINKIQNLPINYVKKIESFLKPLVKSKIKILDYGGDTGNNTPFKFKQNIIHIFDLSQKKSSHENIKIINKKNLLKKYNLIILSNILEHVSFPVIILNEVKKLMDLNSILYIEVPLEKLLTKVWKTDIQNHQIYKNKIYWHEHINFFSKKSLNILLETVGLKIIKIKVLDVVVYKRAQVVSIACKKNY